MISFNKEEIFIVTGASSGIGKAVALLLNELGATVVGIGRSEERLKEMKAESKHPENSFIEVKDLTENINELPAYVKKLKETYGKFQGLIYCAGSPSIEPLQIIDYHKSKEIFDINYFAPIMMAKGFCDRRINMGKGSSMVFVSSIAARKSDKGHTIYGGSKSALTASIKSIAKEVGKYGVRANIVCPSDIKTPMSSIKIEEDEQNYPLGYGEVSDVSNLIIFLSSNKAKWINAQDYVIDCGSF